MSKIYRYICISGGTVGIPVHFLFIIKKNGKSTKAWPILKSNSTLFSFRTIFPRMNNKNFTKRVPEGAPLSFLYEASMVVLIDFIAILLTPGIFLIQIINKLHNKRTLDIFKNVINEYFVYIFVNVFDLFFTHFRNIFKKKTKMKFQNI